MISNKGLDLILEFEVGGSDGKYYNAQLKTPTVPAWRTTQSGVTIGIGWDAGYNTAESLKKEWGEYLPSSAISDMQKVLGLKGKNAYNNLPTVKNIFIDFETAKKQFLKYTVPRFYNVATRVFPNFKSSPQAVQDVLTSLVFNRGGGLKGDSRLEMRNIVAHMQNKKWGKIKDEILKMKRLWPDVKGLLRRRDAEAKFLTENL